MHPEQKPKALLPFNPDGIPQLLRNIPQWAPWEAVWNVKRGKYDKIPYSPHSPEYRLSTAKPDRWGNFDVALAAYNANPNKFAGLGLCVTGVKDLVGVDLDNCIKDGQMAPWAQQVITDMGSYTEVSPSGVGGRIFVTGEQPEDWTNHDIGIEVYAGKDARFLTVSGQVMTSESGLMDTVRPAPEGVLPALQKQYAREKTKATVIDLQMPELLDDAALPSLDDLEIPPSAKDFLLYGTTRGDNSGELHATAVSLYGAGLDHQQVFSLLVSNPHSMGVALSHRRDDHDKALQYLWREQCLKGKPKARPMIASTDDFDDISGAEDVSSTHTPSGASKTKKRRFEFQQAAQYTNRAPARWLIKGVLPHADVGAAFGESGSGKSFFVLDMVMSVAAGTQWAGHPVAQGAVAYICAEGAGGFAKRLQAYAEYYLADLAALPVHILGDAPNFLQADDIKDVIGSVRDIGQVKLVVVDTLAQVTAGGNENSGEDMGKALMHCRKLAQATGAMVLLVAHSGKNADRGLRGWSGIKGALDVEILIERADEHRAATITKMKDGTGEGAEYPFKLENVVLGQDDDGDDITSCVVRFEKGQVAQAKHKKAPIKGVWQQTLVRQLMTLAALTGSPTTTELIDAAIAQMPAEEGKRDRRREQFLRALEALVAADRVAIAGGVVAFAE